MARNLKAEGCMTMLQSPLRGACDLLTLPRPWLGLVGPRSSAQLGLKGIAVQVEKPGF
jgi:hypothetical protein